MIIYAEEVKCFLTFAERPYLRTTSVFATISNLNPEDEINRNEKLQ